MLRVPSVIARYCITLAESAARPIQPNDDEMNWGQAITAIYVVATLAAMLAGAIRAFGFVVVLFSSFAFYLAIRLAIRIRFRVFLAFSVAGGCGIVGHFLAQALSQSDDIVFALAAICFVVAGLWQPVKSQSPPSPNAAADSTPPPPLQQQPQIATATEPKPQTQTQTQTQLEHPRQSAANNWHQLPASMAPLERAQSFELHPSKPNRLRPVLWALVALATAVGFAAWLVNT